MWRRSAMSVSPPLQVRLTDNAGRGVFAAREIAAGEIVHSELPVISHPSPTNMGKVCWWCLKRFGEAAKPVVTLDSSWMTFCSQDCSKGSVDLENNCHWSDFHDYCRENNLRFPLLAKRLACMVAEGMVPPDVIDILYPPSPPSEFFQRWLDEHKSLTTTLTRCGVDSTSLKFFDASWYAGVLARIHLNTFRVETIDTEPTDLRAALMASITGDNVVGSALYMLPSMFNHSCDANVNIYWSENSLARLKALRSVEAGEELTLTYIDASMECGGRRKILQEAYGFHCTCPRCIEDD